MEKNKRKKQEEKMEIITHENVVSLDLPSPLSLLIPILIRKKMEKSWKKNKRKMQEEKMEIITHENVVS